MMKATPISAEFILSQPELSWLELKWGFDHGWLNGPTVVDLAVAQLSANGNQVPEVVELASLGSTQLGEVGFILGKLAETESGQVFIDPERNWLRIILAWLFVQRDEIADPLGAVEEVYANFDYPSEMSGFVRYMPPTDGYDPQAHSLEENVARLYRNWREFLDANGPGSN